MARDLMDDVDMEDRDGDGVPDGAQIKKVVTRPLADGGQERMEQQWVKGRQLMAAENPNARMFTEADMVAREPSRIERGAYGLARTGFGRPDLRRELVGGRGPRVGQVTGRYQAQANTANQMGMQNAANRTALGVARRQFMEPEGLKAMGTALAESIRGEAGVREAEAQAAGNLQQAQVAGRSAVAVAQEQFKPRQMQTVETKDGTFMYDPVTGRMESVRAGGGKDLGSLSDKSLMDSWNRLVRVQDVAGGTKVRKREELSPDEQAQYDAYAGALQARGIAVGAGQGGAAPEGTVVTGKDGKKLVKRGGQWVPMG